MTVRWFFKLGHIMEIVFYVRIFHDLIHIGGCDTVHKKQINKDGFLDDPRDIDWVTTLGPIRPSPEPPP